MGKRSLALVLCAFIPGCPDDKARAPALKAPSQPPPVATAPGAQARAKAPAATAPVEGESAEAASTAADFQRYRKALRRGQRLSAERQYAEAIAAFGRALAIRANDAQANAEIGWAAFKSGDHERAIAASKAAIAHARSQRLKAAALYNLGRALEQKGDRAAAIDAYSKSVTLRRHKVVSARLAKLGAPEPSEPKKYCTTYGICGMEEGRGASETDAQFACSGYCMEYVACRQEVHGGSLRGESACLKACEADLDDPKARDARVKRLQCAMATLNCASMLNC